MKKLLQVALVTLLFAWTAAAQVQSFTAFDDAVRSERGGFSGNKQKLSQVFNAERTRLGVWFEPELWRFLGNDPEKHFWIALFITEKSYLHGNEPLTDLAFRIRERALLLLKDRKDETSLGRQYVILRDMAITTKQLGLQDESIKYRVQAESILESHKDLGPYISGLSEYEKCIYQNLQSDITSCAERNSPKETIISAGILNGRAASLPKPIYPEDAKKKGIGGRVEVRVISDVNGYIISAEVISGPAGTSCCVKGSRPRREVSAY